MTEEEIRRTVREIALEILELEPDELTDKMNFEDAGGDSIQRLELVTALRRELGVEYTLEDEARIESVRTAVRVTQRLLVK